MALPDCKRPLLNIRIVRDPIGNTVRCMNIWSLLSITYTLFFTPMQYDDVPEIEDIQESFGECSVVSYTTADRYNQTDALCEAVRLVFRNLENSRELAFVLNELCVDDVRRFLVDSNGNVKVAVSRLTATSLWRREVFPIDIRKCRVELQSGQLFSYGEDHDGYPVFYFRNMCHGPWRKNADATVSALLHRFDTALSALARIDPNVRLTLIVLLGKPLDGGYFARSTQHNQHDDLSVQGTADSTTTPGIGLTTIDTTQKAKLLECSWNPRIRDDELWYPHTDRHIVQRLIAIVRNHYPERLRRVLLVSGSGFRLARSAIGRQLAIRRALADSKLRSRVFYISRYKDIHRFVEPSQIPAFVGGTALKTTPHGPFEVIASMGSDDHASSASVRWPLLAKGLSMYSAMTRTI